MISEYSISNDVYKQLYKVGVSETKDFYYSVRNYDLTKIKDYNNSLYQLKTLNNKKKERSLWQKK